MPKPRAKKSRKVKPLHLEGYENGQQIDDMDVETFLQSMKNNKQRRLK